MDFRSLSAWRGVPEAEVPFELRKQLVPRERLDQVVDGAVVERASKRLEFVVRRSDDKRNVQVSDESPWVADDEVRKDVFAARRVRVRSQRLV